MTIGLTLVDLAFLGGGVVTRGTGTIPYDSMESYADGADLNGLDGGVDGTHLFLIAWGSAYVDRANFTGNQALDSMETYADGAAVNGLNDGSGFSGAYVDSSAFTGLKASDSMETYADGAAVNGLNDGSGFSGAYVDR